MFTLLPIVGSCYLRILKYLSVFLEERVHIMENKGPFNEH